uniref:carnitine O-palmitoyltransferase 2, mitochondrial isoform X2 n=1 Tax=Myxine glutinosa TaxID=7769 RepID=UPI00358EA458
MAAALISVSVTARCVLRKGRLVSMSRRPGAALALACCSTSRAPCSCRRPLLSMHSPHCVVATQRRPVASLAASDPGYLHRSIVPTLHFQKSLPRLPIPKLEDTLRRYLAAQQPFLNEAAFRRTEDLTRAFEVEEGQRLHKELLAKDKKNKHTSYISEPWFNMYLSGREPVVLNHNPFMLFAKEERPAYSTQAVRATNLAISAARFLCTLRDGVLEPDVFHLNPAKTDTPGFRRWVRLLPPAFSWYGAYLRNAYPLDMSQYVNLFSSTRIPCALRDQLYMQPDARHVLVMRRGHLYTFDLLDERGDILSPLQILARFQYIISDPSPWPRHPLGFLTTERRDTWAALRQRLLETGNSAALKSLDSAVLCFCLDEENGTRVQSKEDVAASASALSHAMLHGRGGDRWFDKSLSVIVANDGNAAVNFEHSWGDGVAVLRFMNEVFQKQKVSPDGVLQLALQLAYLRLYGTPADTYESCSTAAFRHGRTETIRPASRAAIDCCHAFFARSPFQASSLRPLVQTSCLHHGQLTKEAAMGQGFDRHLFALRRLAMQQNGGDATQVPAFYQDPAYARLNHIILSTSTLSSDAVTLGGFAPVTPNGLGVAYGIHNDWIGCNVSAYTSQNVPDLMRALDMSLQEIGDVLLGKDLKK